MNRAGNLCLIVVGIDPLAVAVLISRHALHGVQQIIEFFYFCYAVHAQVQTLDIDLRIGPDRME